ncbi:MAG: aminodeoxychorismate synthase component I [Acidobacteria bacterium]|nr:aminodeoxychorismate synthase component I [Acidobacteriota bacterium]
MGDSSALLNCVILREAARGTWLRFGPPVRILTARRTGEVVPALEEVGRLVREDGVHAAGFVAYEAAPAFDPALAAHPARGSFPLLWFGLYREPVEIALPEPDFGACALGPLRPGVSRELYAAAIARIHDYIRCGDTYQVNYTLRLRGSFRGDPWNLFLSMVRAQPAGYGAYIDTGRGVVCSASPELFFRTAGGALTAKPMKGTAGRGRTTLEDRRQAEWLHRSEKNRAENLMIVDMIRNDLGRVARTGSVRVPALFEIERHPTLWQMTSTVTAECDRPPVEIFRALFPCASITGAPKIRTSAIIRELEPEARGVYTGSIGYLSPGGGAQFNVAIRTALVDRERRCVEYGAGGGIVADSAAGDEYGEALLKARVLQERPGGFSLLETLLWTPGEGWFLLGRHLDRMADSAAYFGYILDREELGGRLGRMAAAFSQPRKVRLLLGERGEAKVEAAPLPPAGLGPVRVRVAHGAVDSSDPFLYHKTTRREVYERAQRRHPGAEDVLCANERGELTESTIANLVLEVDGGRFTPPVESGLLAGVFRGWLLERGEITERVLRPADLERSTGIWLVNSVRRWRRALLI